MIKIIVVVLNIVCMVINDKDDFSISEYYLYGHI